MRIGILSFALVGSMLLTSCGKSVTSFNLFPLSNDVALNNSNAELIAKILITSTASGGFSKKGPRNLHVIISNSRSEIVRELQMTFDTDVQLDLNGHWEMNHGPVFVLDVHGTAEDCEFSNTIKLDM